MTLEPQYMWSQSPTKAKKWFILVFLFEVEVEPSLNRFKLIATPFVNRPSQSFFAKHVSSFAKFHSIHAKHIYNWYFFEDKDFLV